MSRVYLPPGVRSVPRDEVADDWTRERVFDAIRNPVGLPPLLDEFASGDMLSIKPQLGMPLGDYEIGLLEGLPKEIRRELRSASFERMGRGWGHRAGLQAWAELVNPQDVQIADATAVVGTTEGLLFAFDKTYVPPQFWQEGRIARLYVAGKLTTAGASPGNWTTTSRWGTTTAGTSIAASAALALQVSQTNISWVVDIMYVCRTKGATGTVIAIGTVAGGTGTTLFTTGPQAGIPASAPAVATIDTTTNSAVLLDTTLGSASDSQTAQIVSLLLYD